MAEPFALLEDVIEGWGELTVDEERLVQAWLSTASNNLRLTARKRGIDIDAFIQGDSMLVRAARDAVVESVRRRLTNPRAIRQRSTNFGAGPFADSSTETVDSTASSGLLYFTDTELQWLPIRPHQRFRTLRANSGYYA